MSLFQTIILWVAGGLLYFMALGALAGAARLLATKADLAEIELKERKR